MFSFAYYKGYITYEYFYTYCKLLAFFGSLVCLAHFNRGTKSRIESDIRHCLLFALISKGIGRNSNSDYRLFIREYIKLYTKTESKSERREFLMKYDFELKDWAPDYIASRDHPVL